MKALYHAPLGSDWKTFEVRCAEVDLEEMGSTWPGWCQVRTWKDLGPITPDPKWAGVPRIHEGFFDTHLHVIWVGQTQTSLVGDRFDSVEGWLEALRQSLLQLEAGEILYGYAWDESRWGLSQERLSEKLVEAMLPDRSFLLYRLCGHAAFASPALRQQLKMREMPFLVGDVDLAQIRKHLPSPTPQTQQRHFFNGQTELLAFGINAVGDMSLEEEHFQAIVALMNEGKVHLDVQGILLDGCLPTLEARGPYYQQGAAPSALLGVRPTFSVRHWKRYLDGSLGTRSAWLSRPYDDAETFGQSLFELQELARASKAALDKGFCLSFHAIGDAALDQVLELGEGLEKMMRERLERPGNFPLPGTRHRIEHAQVMRDDQRGRLAAQDFWAVCAQPSHWVADQSFVRARLGAERLLKWGYRAASLLEAGIPLVLGTDAPVTVSDPTLVLQAACTHPNPAERMDADFALWAYTRGARRLLGLPERSLSVGSRVRLSSLNF